MTDIVTELRVTADYSKNAEILHRAAKEILDLRRAAKANSDYLHAIEFAIEQGNEGILFLENWMHGDTKEWPEFKAKPEQQ